MQREVYPASQSTVAESSDASSKAARSWSSLPSPPSKSYQMCQQTRPSGFPDTPAKADITPNGSLRQSSNL